MSLRSSSNKLTINLASGLINMYQVLLSPFLGPRCRFVPSCSDYGKQAIRAYGVLGGSMLLTKRLLKCHPFHAGGLDPLPLINKN